MKTSFRKQATLEEELLSLPSSTLAEAMLASQMSNSAAPDRAVPIGRLGCSQCAECLPCRY